MTREQKLRSTNEQKSIWGLLLELSRHLHRRRRRQFIWLLILMVIASAAEVFSIGALLPFLGLLTAPDMVFGHPLLKPTIDAMGVSEAKDLIVPAAIIFGAVALTSGAIRILLVYATTRYSFSVGADISFDAYSRTLYQPYRVHLLRNSSEVINGIIQKCAVVMSNVLLPLLTLFSSSFLLFGIFSALLLVDAVVALSAGGVFGVIYLVIIGFSRRRLSNNSAIIAQRSTEVVKALQEGLGGIRDVLLDGTQKVYQQIYWRADRPFRLAQADNTFISAAPRHLIETIGILLIVVFSVVLSSREGGLVAAAPLLGAIALGAQRLLPVLQQAYSSFSTISGSRTSIADVLELLDQPMPQEYAGTLGSVQFEGIIDLKKIDFRYADDGPNVLTEIDLSIGKGERIGIMGETGSGKSTLLDIIMGLLEPTSGIMQVDSDPVDDGNRRAWQKHVAHVPQSIFLADSSIAENIAFGVPLAEIDMDAVRSAAERARIAATIGKLPNSYLTSVGERGVRLSGGQRQRIGIARALYKKADLLVLDEATSALDTNTEKEVMAAVRALDRELTVIIVAHRVTTLEHCDRVIEIANGRIKRVGSYSEFLD